MKKNTKITIITLITLISIIFISVIIIKNTNKVNANNKSEEEKTTINTTEFAEESATEKSISDNISDKKNNSDKKTDSDKNDKTESNKNGSNTSDKTNSNKNTSDNSNKTESTTEAKTETTTEAKKPKNNNKPETTTEAKTEATTEKKPNTTEQPFDELPDETFKPVNHTHSWDSGKVTTQPTCTAAGTKTYTCTSCGATKTESIVAKGHNWTTKTEKVEVVPGHYTTKYIDGYRCDICGFFNTNREVVKKHCSPEETGHNAFGQAQIEEQVWVDPIYDEVTTTYCTVCGEQK